MRRVICGSPSDVRPNIARVAPRFGAGVWLFNRNTTSAIELLLESCLDCGKNARIVSIVCFNEVLEIEKKIFGVTFIYLP
jgi:ferredoxin-like protein FixX